MVRAINERTGLLTTQAGVGVVGTSGDGGQATAAELDLNEGTCAVAVDHAGNLLIDQNDRIRVVIKHSGTWYGRYRRGDDIYTIAGGGTRAPRDGEPATRVNIGFSSGVAVDPAGNVVIADWPGNRILLAAVKTGTFYGVRARAGDIYTIAGDGKAGFSGDRGAARRAELHSPVGVAVDRWGNVLIADAGNHRVRIVPARSGHYFGYSLRAGDIYTIAGNGTREPLGPAGNARSAGLEGPAQIWVDAAGNLLIADGSDDAFGVVVTRTGKAPYCGGCHARAGDIYTVAGFGVANGAVGVTVDMAGNIIMSNGSPVLRVYAEHTGLFYGQHMTAGSVYPIAGNGDYDALGGTSGDGRPALTAQFGLPTAIAVDSTGSLAIVDRQNATVRLVSHSTGSFYGQPMMAGRMYTIDSDPRLFGLYGVAFDQAGNLIMTTGNFGGLLVLAVQMGTFYGQPMTAGETYLISGHGTQSADGIPAAAAALHYPAGVTVDASGNILVADWNDSRVRCIAGSSGMFYGQQMTAGDIYTIAGNETAGYSGDGGPAIDASVSPTGLAVDAHGNVVIADPGNFRIRVVAASTGTFYGQPMTAGDIYTIGGSGTNANNGDGGPATSAAISASYWDQSLAIDSAGNVIITTTGRIRVIAAATGTFYGVPMQSGDIYTVAGTGKAGFSGDGGPAVHAEFTGINSVTIGPGGDILVGDTLRIRSISP